MEWASTGQSDESLPPSGPPVTPPPSMPLGPCLLSIPTPLVPTCSLVRRCRPGGADVGRLALARTHNSLGPVCMRP